MHTLPNNPLPVLVQELHNKNLLWFANHAPQSHHAAQSTGFSLLDENLEGGFPEHGVIEISTELGIGELRLLVPYLKQKENQRLCVLINPPAQINPHAFYYEGIDHSKIIIVQTDDKSSALWAAEQSLKSGSCHTVIAWQDNLEIHQARRLQVASEQGNCLQFLFKRPTYNTVSLPISLSLLLKAEPSGLNVTITKRKGGHSQQSFVIALNEQWPQLTQTPPLHQQHNADIISFPIQKQG